MYCGELHSGQEAPLTSIEWLAVPRHVGKEFFMCDSDSRGYLEVCLSLGCLFAKNTETVAFRRVGIRYEY